MQKGTETTWVDALPMLGECLERARKHWNRATIAFKMKEVDVCHATEIHVELSQVGQRMLDRTLIHVGMVVAYIPDLKGQLLQMAFNDSMRNRHRINGKTDELKTKKSRISFCA